MNQYDVWITTGGVRTLLIVNVEADTEEAARYAAIAQVRTKYGVVDLDVEDVVEVTPEYGDSLA